MVPSLGTYHYRVLYADTDLAGVVYHGHYLRFFEAARTQLMCDAGLPPADVQADEQIVFAVTEVGLNYHQPARYGDVLRIEVEPTKVGPARFTLAYRVYRPEADEPCVTGWTTICALRLDTQRVARLPAAMRAWCEAALAP